MRSVPVSVLAPATAASETATATSLSRMTIPLVPPSHRMEYVAAPWREVE